MEFFAQQEAARRASRWLVLWFLLATAFVATSLAITAALGATVFAMVVGTAPVLEGTYVWHGAAGYFADVFRTVALGVLGVAGMAVAATIVGMTAMRWWQLREGGTTIAWLLGAHALERSRVTPDEAKLLNVVEEMAIASGIAVPPVYLLDREEAVNALVAGYSPNEAVIIVTHGAVRKLSRDELQGVMGHEFSHILNGDMALNLRLVSVLAGIACFSEWGEAMMFAGAYEAAGKAREERGAEVLWALLGGVMAFVGFPGLFAAEAIKAAVSRHREMLADAASVQFTRNPEGIAGALDSIRYLSTGTTLRSAYAAEISHMFFAPAVVRWWAWPTHPPIEERIRRVHPGFRPEDYRKTRHASLYRERGVAVLDGAGGVVKVIEGVGKAAALVEAPRPEHVDHARRLLERLPTVVRERLATPEGAAQVMYALLLERDGPVRERQLQRLGAEAEQAAAARFELQDVGRRQFLLLVELALPALKEWPQTRRDAFLGTVQALVEADEKTTLGEFVQLTLLRQRLREGAGKPIPTKFRRVEEVAQDARAVISLIAHVSNGDTDLSYAKGRAILGMELAGPLAIGELSAGRIGNALERLRHLQPFEKPRVLKACVETAAADGPFRLAEMELVRAVAATLDCPIPPVIQSLDPAKLAA